MAHKRQRDNAPADHGFTGTRLNAILRTVTIVHMGNVGSRQVNRMTPAWRKVDRDLMATALRKAGLPE